MTDFWRDPILIKRAVRRGLAWPNHWPDGPSPALCAAATAFAFKHRRRFVWRDRDDTRREGRAEVTAVVHAACYHAAWGIIYPKCGVTTGEPTKSVHEAYESLAQHGCFLRGIQAAPPIIRSLWGV